ncbi:MAG TPA: hypothetical protein VF484_10810 [Candidatus Limnocylindrales bacterium]
MATRTVNLTGTRDRATDRSSRAGDAWLRLAIVVLALATGYIHLTLGGTLFTLNAVGYGVAAIAMVVPIGLAIRYRWLVRLGLIGYAATAIVAWYLTGPRYDVAYLAKAIEIVLIALLAVDFVRHDGTPLAVLRRLSTR